MMYIIVYKPYKEKQPFIQAVLVELHYITFYIMSYMLVD